MYRRRFLLALVFLVPAVPLPAQDLVSAFANRIQADVAFLSSPTILAAWQQSHPDGRLELAHLGDRDDPFEVDFMQINRWCAASLSNAPPQVDRAALFYLPSVKRGALPPLPAEVDPLATQACQLHAIWYETRALSSTSPLLLALSSLWGAPNGPTTRPSIQGSGLWNGAVSWNRQGIIVWVAIAPDTRHSVSRGPRLIVLATRVDPADSDGLLVNLLDEKLRSQTTDAAAKIAARDAALTAGILERSHCENAPNPREAETLTVDRLARWLKQSAGLPPEQRAASLLVADAYIACAGSDGPGMVALGAVFQQVCNDGVFYNHSFREQAEKLVPDTRVAELAAVAGFTQPCSLKGRGSWFDLVIMKGNRLLAQLPPDEWTPWMHYAVARAHAVRLGYSYPGADAIGGDPIPLTAAAKQQERAAATTHFRQFVRDKPDAPESVSAWYEAWRLLAGLPPSPISFGCDCD